MPEHTLIDVICRALWAYPLCILCFGAFCTSSPSAALLPSSMTFCSPGPERVKREECPSCSQLQRGADLSTKSEMHKGMAIKPHRDAPGLLFTGRNRKAGECVVWSGSRALLSSASTTVLNPPLNPASHTALRLFQHKFLTLLPRQRTPV